MLYTGIRVLSVVLLMTRWMQNSSPAGDGNCFHRSLRRRLRHSLQS